MKIKVKNKTGPWMDISLEPTDMVGDIPKNLGVEGSTVIFNGKKLTPENTLTEAGIRDGAKVMLVGAKPSPAQERVEEVSQNYKDNGFGHDSTGFPMKDFIQHFINSDIYLDFEKIMEKSTFVMSDLETEIIDDFGQRLSLPETGIGVGVGGRAAERPHKKTKKKRKKITRKKITRKKITRKKITRKKYKKRRKKTKRRSNKTRRNTRGVYDKKNIVGGVGGVESSVDLMTSGSASPEGVGLEISALGYVMNRTVKADRAGVQIGSYISKVGDVDVRGVDDINKALRRLLPRSGTNVNFTMYHPFDLVVVKEAGDTFGFTANSRGFIETVTQQGYDAGLRVGSRISKVDGVIVDGLGHIQHQMRTVAARKNGLITVTTSYILPRSPAQAQSPPAQAPASGHKSAQVIKSELQREFKEINEWMHRSGTSGAYGYGGPGIDQVMSRSAAHFNAWITYFIHQTATNDAFFEGLWKGEQNTILNGTSGQKGLNHAVEYLGPSDDRYFQDREEKFEPLIVAIRGNRRQPAICGGGASPYVGGRKRIGGKLPLIYGFIWWLWTCILDRILKDTVDMQNKGGPLASVKYEHIYGILGQLTHAQTYIITGGASRGSGKIIGPAVDGSDATLPHNTGPELTKEIGSLWRGDNAPNPAGDWQMKEGILQYDREWGSDVACGRDGEYVIHQPRFTSTTTNKQIGLQFGVGDLGTHRRTLWCIKGSVVVDDNLTIKYNKEIYSNIKNMEKISAFESESELLLSPSIFILRCLEGGMKWTEESVPVRREKEFSLRITSDNNRRKLVEDVDIRRLRPYSDFGADFPPRWMKYDRVHRYTSPAVYKKIRIYSVYVLQEDHANKYASACIVNDFFREDDSTKRDQRQKLINYLKENHMRLTELIETFIKGRKSRSTSTQESQEAVLDALAGRPV